MGGLGRHGQEESGQRIGVFDDVAGPDSGEVAEVAVEVGLIVVAAGQGHLRPRASIVLETLLEHALEADEAGESLGPKPHRGLEPTAKLAVAQLELAGQSLDVECSLGRGELSRRARHRRIAAALPLPQEGLENRDPALRRARGFETGGKRAGVVAKGCGERNNPVHEAAEVARNEGAHPGGMKVDADRVNDAARLDVHAALHLADEEQVRLFAPSTARAALEKGVCELEHELHAAVGKDAMPVGHCRRSAPSHEPEVEDVVREVRRGRKPLEREIHEVR